MGSVEAAPLTNESVKLGTKRPRSNQTPTHTPSHPHVRGRSTMESAYSLEQSFGHEIAVSGHGHPTAMHTISSHLPFPQRSVHALSAF